MNQDQKMLCRWLEAATEDQDLIRELLTVRNDEKEVHERFYQSLEFGTAGLRGELGAGSNRMNIYTVRQATQGFAAFLRGRNPKPSIAIAYDSRHKSELFAQETAAIMEAKGVKV